MAEMGRVLLAAGVAAALGAVLSGRRWPLRLAAVGVVGAVGVLAWAFLTNDVSLAVVAETSRADAPWWYRVSALWGGPEGSLLVFVAVVAVVAAAAGGVPASVAERRLLAAPIAALGALSLLAADPFGRLALPPVDGAGLVPILEHPAMALHPPLLYAGLAATLPAYARALGGRHQEPARSWLLVAVGLLAAAMAAGALWSYVEAGWGGAWAWDPVENAGLVVWLAAVAVLHAGRAGGRPGRWAAVPWVAVLLGAALTRGGATASVHAFSEDPGLGRRLLALGLVSGAAVFVLPWTPPGRPPGDATRSRPTRIAAGTAAVAATVAALVVAAGTAAPVVRSATGGDATAIGGWFYSRVLAPVAVVALVAILATAAVRLRRRSAVAAGAGLLTVTVTVVAGWPVPASLLAGLGAAAAVAAVLVASGRPAWLAHAGLALVLVASAGLAATEAATVTLGPGESVAVGGVTVRLEEVAVVDGPRPGTEAVEAHVVAEDGGRRRPLRPALVAYPAWRGVLAETALWTRPHRDVQVHLVDADDLGRALLEVRVRPVAGLLWVGAVLVAGGALLAAYEARRAARMVVPPSSAPGCSHAHASQSISAAHHSG